MKTSRYRFFVDGELVLEAEVTQEELHDLHNQFLARYSYHRHSLLYKRVSD